MHSGMLVGFKYRDDVHLLERMVEMGFDTGSDLTYLTMVVYNPILEIVSSVSSYLIYKQFALLETNLRIVYVHVQTRCK